MKKILLLLVSGMLILSLAGSAIASPAKIKLCDLSGNEIVGPIMIPADGTPVTVKMEVSDIFYSQFPPDGTHDRTFSVKVASGPIEVQTSNDGSTWLGWTSGETSFGYTAEASKDYCYLVQIKGTNDGTISVKDISDDYYTDDGSELDDFDYGIETYEVQIPEFPTVALPVAAILGLVFIFGRRKEGL
ncbi:PEF-CTERM sorting domain-containing protein [Methanosarcina sp. MTP4]|uniref:PEF-CTERM sorting domain-containing protein n=1 Tax=Methanosarcina sp. MTP4 TaxID=1434100 RepID=UPI000695D466|nr:PEF-CTERM sorting domain-containing protein [Methanosarcina sp. MTP4]